MKLSFYFLKQFLPPFFFGWVLFTFVFLLNRLFDLIDLIINKGVPFLRVLNLFFLFIPTVFPLSLPMAILLGCMVAFGRISEENELTAVRAAGVHLARVLALIPAFALGISLFMIPFNSRIAPVMSSGFQMIFEKIIKADPLINIAQKKFFAIKNIKIYAEKIDPLSKKMQDVFVFQIPEDNRPFDRIFAREGDVQSTEESFQLTLRAGQLQRFDGEDASKILHITFGQYQIQLPLLTEEAQKVSRFRSIPTATLKAMVKDIHGKGLKTNYMDAEISLRTALAFSPLCLCFIGMPLAVAFKKGGRTFNLGISLLLIFAYYLLLIFGLNIAEKGVLNSNLALWIGNIFCLLGGTIFTARMFQR